MPAVESTGTGTEKTFTELGHDSLQGFIQATFKEIMKVTLCSNSLPAMNEEHGYWESYDIFKNRTSSLGSRILENIGNLLEHSAVQCKWGYSHSSGKSSADIDDQFEKLVDANDILLENVGSLLDEAAGIKRKGTEEPVIMTSMLKKNSVISSWNKRKEFLNKSAPYKLLMAKNIHRPQLNWMEKIDNRNLPFVPYINYKPNALLPNEDDRRDRDIFADIEKGTQGGCVDLTSKHPYYYELSQFEPSEWQLDVQTPITYLTLDDTELSIIDSQESLDEMMGKLREVKEIAIDLEHHNYRSFQGIVCLIQISTRKEDFIVDSLKLRDELCVLNEVFTDPAILKVLHGSDADIGWLQRDFGVYVVNMFDTGQAARTLQESRFSLAHLLQKYCNITAQKQYQLADWRIRPLPVEMIKYAREDTHYLLYIYDVLRNELITRGNEMKNILRLVYTKSTDLCASLYKKQLCHPDSHVLLYQKYKKNFNAQQLECFRLLFQWRDKIARQEDESTGYVLPNHMMFQISENMPKDQEGVIACCNPVPPLVNQHVSDLVRLANEGRFYEGKGEEVELEEMEEDDLAVAPKQSEKDKEKLKIGPLDPRPGFEVYKIIGPKVEVFEPTLTLFSEIEDLDIGVEKKKALELNKMLRSPFELYLPNWGKVPVYSESSNKNLSEEKIPKEIQQEDRNIPVISATSATSSSFGNIDFVPMNSTSTVGKKKRRRNAFFEEEEALRELLPKKSKLKPLDEHLDEVTALQEKEQVAPTLTNLNKNDSFLPFDYSKTDLNKFNQQEGTSKTNYVNLEETEEPKFDGPIKTKVHSGARQMSF